MVSNPLKIGKMLNNSHYFYKLDYRVMSVKNLVLSKLAMLFNLCCCEFYRNNLDRPGPALERAIVEQELRTGNSVHKTQIRIHDNGVAAQGP